MKKEGDEKNEDQTSGWLGWAVQKGSMWSSVRGSTGGLTNGLHYKRKARRGSDPTGTCEGVAVVPARNKWNNRSGGCARAARSLAGSRRGAPLKTQRAVLTHRLLHVVPQLSLNEVLAVFWQRESQTAKRTDTIAPAEKQFGGFSPSKHEHGFSNSDQCGVSILSFMQNIPLFPVKQQIRMICWEPACEYLKEFESWEKQNWLTCSLSR